MTDNTVSEVKSRLNVVDFIGEYVRLTKAGSSFKGLCPFHTEKTPSFNVSEERQSFHCFGCQKGGDAFTFLMEIEGVGFREALKILADRAGVALPAYNPVMEKKIKSGYEVLESATKWYEAQLHSPAGNAARKYLLDRGISEENIQTFRLGFSLDGWNHVKKHLKSLGYSEQEIEQTGLLAARNAQRVTHSEETESEGTSLSDVTRYTLHATRSYDRFRNRIMFPISDVLGRVIGYSARVMPGADEKQGKYINTPETALYHKSRILYGIAQAKQAIKRENKVIVVEGNMDVIAMHQAGFQNTVAVSGTAMTEEHIKIIKRYTRNTILFFDMDRAGKNAAYKSTIACLSGEMNVSVMTVVGSKDAAELAQNDPLALRNAVQSAKGAMEFFTEEVLSEHNLSKPEEKKEAVEKLLPLLGSLVNEVEQFDWVRKIAEKIDVEATAVAAALTRYTERQSGTIRSENRSFERAPVLEKSRSEVLRGAILAGMLESPFVWKKMVEHIAEEAVPPEIVESLRGTPLAEKIFSLGESVAYNFDHFREMVQDDDLVREAQGLMAHLGEFEEDTGNEEKKWGETRRLLSELEKEILRKRLDDLVRNIRASDQAGDIQTRDRLAQEFGEVSRKMQSF